MISIVTTCPESYSLWLAECCVSVERQTVKNWEHVIVSVDSVSVPLIAKAFETRIISLDHDPGLSTCRNIGVAAAKGDYIMMLDADDWLAPDFIEKVTPFLVEDRLIGGSLQRFGEESGLIASDSSVSLKDLLHSNPIFYNAIFHRSMFPGYDQALDEFGYEDWDLWLQMFSPDDCHKPPHFVRVLDAVLHYRIHKDSHTHRSWNHHESRMAYLREKHGVK